jgi:hypothetical protein
MSCALKSPKIDCLSKKQIPNFRVLNQCNLCKCQFLVNCTCTCVILCVTQFLQIHMVCRHVVLWGGVVLLYCAFLWGQLEGRWVRVVSGCGGLPPQPTVQASPGPS